ncbi:unnamed protein product [Durusdinium trenchii]|uniref:Pseudouridine synthase RsuA/RluA-like domain-containing protein n=2 Tax=Durusdinium trenchii TaxID=1381693 RepID=A0ABP0LTU4_9DINO
MARAALAKPAADVSQAISVGFSQRISRCRREGKWQEAVYLLAQMRRGKALPNDITCNMVISACAKGGHWQLAVDLLCQMPAVQVTPDLISYNSAINACEVASEWAAALACFKALEEKQLQPDIIVYGGVISACAKAGFWQLTLRIFEELCRRMSPDLVACNAALRAFKGNRWPVANAILQNFDDFGLQADVVTFSTAITSCVDAWPMTLQLLTEMHSAQIEANVWSFSSAMTCMSGAALSAWPTSLDLLRAMKSSQVEPNHFSLSSAISTGLSSWPRAVSLLPVKMSRVCYVSALASCASSMAWEAALACLTAMQNAQMTPGAVEVGTLAESFNRALGHKAARELLCSVSTSWKAGKKDAVPNFTAEEIIMQGPGLLMANKPESTSTEEFAAALAARLNCRLSVTSRLDHPTSGVLPLAFGTESSMEKWLVAQLAARLVEKEYLCLCEGEALGPPGTTGLVVAPIRTMELDGHTSRSEVSPTGRIARTEYQVLRRFSCRGAQWAEDTSEVMLLAAHPITGRTHQIRVHFAFLGRPLLGDLTYGRRDSLSVCPRLFLHCRRFSCIGPDGTPLVAEAPLPPELQNVLETL